MSCPAKLSLCTKQGTDFLFSFQLLLSDGITPVSVAGATIVSKMRKNIADAVAALTFVCTVTDGPNGKFQIYSPGITTAALVMDAEANLSLAPTKYIYDVLLTQADGTIIPIVEGQISVHPETSK